MLFLLIFVDWKVKCFILFFIKENVFVVLLSYYNIVVGVFGQLCVMEGMVIYYGFVNEQVMELEKKVVIYVGQFVISLLQYWYCVEFSDDVCFNIYFWVVEEIDGENGLFYVKKV